MSKKKIKEICNNCRLYNREKCNCRLAIFHEGKEMHIPVDPQDECFFQEHELAEEIKQIRFWCENPETGEPSKEGIVKVEIPTDLTDL